MHSIRRVPLLVTLLLLAAACAARSAETPAQRLYAVQADFNVLQRAALAYAEQPDCDPPAVIVACARPAVRTRIRAAATEARAAVAAARASLESGGGGADLALAAAAVRSLAAALAARETGR